MGMVRPDHGPGPDRRRSTRPSARKRGRIGYVPQSEDVDWAFPVSVRDVVMMGRYGHQGFTRRTRPADQAAVAEALDRVELTAYADRQIGQLSGGQKKRAFVARGIAQGAQILLLDEPFAGVDKRSEATIVGLLKELAADGRTILVSTHDLHALPQPGRRGGAAAAAGAVPRLRCPRRCGRRTSPALSASTSTRSPGEGAA